MAHPFSDGFDDGFGGTDVQVIIAALTLAPVDAVINDEVNAAATTGALSLAPVKPTVNDATKVVITTGALTLAPVDTAVKAAITVTRVALRLAPVDAYITAPIPSGSSLWTPITDQTTSWS